MAHEFKTPLTTVMAATTALLANPDQPAEARMGLLKIADEETKHLDELITDAVEIGRLDTANIQVEMEPAEAEEIVREVVSSMRNQIDDREVLVMCDRSPKAVSTAVCVDRRLIRLALKQVLDNALKYSPPGSAVTITVGGGDGGVAVAITDHGKGIPMGEQSRIFERLYRSPSAQNQTTGYGLGLNIAQNIVRAHHGELTVNSHPGETTFCMTLPASDTRGRT